MRATRRTWTIAAAGVTLLGLGVVADRPLLLLGGATVGAWLLSRQYAAYRAVRSVHDGLSVDVTTARTRVPVEDDVRLTVTAQLSEPAPTAVDVSLRVPPAATAGPDGADGVRLDRGDVNAVTTVTCSFPTAGRFTVPSPVATVSDGDGLFVESFERGESPPIHVVANEPRDVSVGRGGEEIATSYGEHPAGRSGSGLTPAELRRYLPGDALNRIDWKATARHGEPYVREFEAETDRRTVLVVDHRARMAHGPAGRTQFEYAREVALGFVGAAQSATDPVGCWTVGDAGITGTITPGSTTEGYVRVRERLETLEPTVTADGAGPSPGRGAIRPAVARTRAAHLDGEDTPFAARLGPFFDAADPYVERFAGDPLYATVRRIQADVPGTTWHVFLTDDADRDRLREAVRLATADGGFALVFLTPRVLFADDALDDLESAYARYVDFEEFRTELDRLGRVTAFEVGPGDRLDALIAARERTTSTPR